MFVPVLTYHQIHPFLNLGITSVHPNQFHTQIEYLAKNGYKSLTLKELVNQQSFERDEKYVVITFDDAYRCIFEYAYPVLKSFGFKATIFVIANYVGKLNQWDYCILNNKFYHCDWLHLKILQENGWEIGSHSLSHRALTNVSCDEAWHEIKYSKEIIEKHLNCEVNFFSFPFGKYNHKLLQMVLEAGYSGGCTLGKKSRSSLNKLKIIDRRGVYLIDPLMLFKAKLKNNKILGHFEDLKQEVLSFFSNGTILYHNLKKYLNK